MRTVISAVAIVATAVAAPLSAQSTTGVRGCETDNAGIKVPTGFCVGVYAKGLSSPRHMAVADNGDVYVVSNSGGLFRMRDKNNDGKADTVIRVADARGSGLWIARNFLYTEIEAPRTRGGGAPAPTVIVRYALAETLGAPDTIVTGLPVGGHTTRDMVVRGNMLYVNVGSMTNSCQTTDRQSNVKGADPCTELATRAGTWEFDATRKNQAFGPANRFATGIRNGVSLTLSPWNNELYVVQHGRDQLMSNWGRSKEESAENPGEELFHVQKGKDFGWPYCYYSTYEKKKVTAPEYGGDGKSDDRCRDKTAPIYAFPGHWAPNAAHFYSGSQFPKEYRDGIFVAFHGSWNRDSLPQAGFNVTFLPFKDDKATGPHRVFAEGFQQLGERPTGFAQLPDGSLLVSDDGKGNIFRIVYTGR